MSYTGLLQAECPSCHPNSVKGLHVARKQNM